MSVRTEDRGGVRIVTFEDAAELLPVLAAAEADAAVHAVVLTGDFTVRSPAETKTIRDVTGAVERSAKTYVAALAKTALGGGFELALACDYRVAAAGTKLGFPEIAFGLIPARGRNAALTAR